MELSTCGTYHIRLQKGKDRLHDDGSISDQTVKLFTRLRIRLESGHRDQTNFRPSQSSDRLHTGRATAFRASIWKMMVTVADAQKRVEQYASKALYASKHMNSVLRVQDPNRILPNAPDIATTNGKGFL